MIRRFLIWLKLTFSSIMMRIGIALHRTEEDILTEKGGALSEKDKKNQRIRHRNQVLEKMLQGQRDEKYVKDYYEILKKADEFVLNANAEKAEMVAAKHGGLGYGQKDKWGRRYEHYGFFDPKSKHYGKSIKDVLKREVDERRIDDDDYEVEIMFKNNPVTEGFAKTDDGLVTNPLKEALLRKFPLRAIYNNDESVNRIEKLTDYLHVKRIGEELKVVEFFISSKYGVYKLDEDNDIYKELIDVKQIWFNDEYGNPYGYSIKNYVKRLKYGENKVIADDNSPKHLYDIIKFTANKITNLE